MTKIKVQKFIFNIIKNKEKGLTLVELLVALVIGGIILTSATSALINLLTANQELESKITRNANLSRALYVIQNDIRSAKSITKEALSSGSCNSTKVSSQECLVLTFPTSYNSELNLKCTSNTIESQVYYGFNDIRSGTHIWLKPGVLKRKVVCNDSSGNQVNTNWIVVADGLISVNEIFIFASKNAINQKTT